jgi:hypothetical protein
MMQVLEDSSNIDALDPLLARVQTVFPRGTLN